MRKSFLPFSPPMISEGEIDEVVDTLRSDWITTGPNTNRFENAFAEFINMPDALALNSCTAGLHLALLALGIRPGDEVITTPMTFCSTVNVIEHVGATPVLVDVEPDTLNISPSEVEKAITSKTKCILAVHYAGHPCDMNALTAIAQEHHLSLIEDAAHAVSATYRGRKIGTIGDMTAFSFYATKNLTTAEGGMLTGKQEYLDKARVLSLHGMNRDAWKRYGKGGSWFYEVVAPGFKYNMTDIQASIGLQQLIKIGSMQTRRKRIVKQYNHAFSGLPYFQIPVERSEASSSWHLYVLRLNLDALTIDRDRFIDSLTALNIGTSVHFIPVHMHPFYRDKYGFLPITFPVAYSNYKRMISLPLHPRLSDAEIEDVIEAVLQTAEKYRR